MAHWLYNDGLVQDCSNSSALAMELLQTCTKSSICSIRNRNLKINCHIITRQDCIYHVRTVHKISPSQMPPSSLQLACCHWDYMYKPSLPSHYGRGLGTKKAESMLSKGNVKTVDIYELNDTVKCSYSKCFQNIHNGYKGQVCELCLPMSWDLTVYDLILKVRLMGCATCFVCVDWWRKGWSMVACPCRALVVLYRMLPIST